METRKMNRAYFDARIARVNNLMGVDYKVEMGSAYTGWKVTNSTGSRIIGYCNTRKELDAFISGMIEAAHYFNTGE